jgi:hypothetical protein
MISNYIFTKNVTNIELPQNAVAVHCIVALLNFNSFIKKFYCWPTIYLIILSEIPGVGILNNKF